MTDWDNYIHDRDEAKNAHRWTIQSFDSDLAAGRMTDEEHTAAVARANEGLQTRMAELRHDYDAAYTDTSTYTGGGACALVALALGAGALTVLSLGVRALLG